MQNFIVILGTGKRRRGPPREWLLNFLNKGLFFCYKIDTWPYTLFFHKQLDSSPSPQSCLIFLDFQGSKLLSSCLDIEENWGKLRKSGENQPVTGKSQM